MNRNTIQRLSRRALALVLAAALLFPTAFAAAGTPQLTTTQTLADGLTYRNTVSSHSSAGRVESFALELEPGSGIYPIAVQGSGNIYGSGTITRAVQLAENMGYQVVGGINGDFYTLSTGVPNGLSIENGVYRSSSGGYPAVAMVGGQLQLCQSPQIAITLTNQRTGRADSPDHFNKWRDYDGGLYLFNADFSSSTRTQGSGGWVVVLELTPDSQGASLTVNSTLTLEVASVTDTSQAVDIGANQYILTADHASSTAEFFAGYEVGDRVTLTTSCFDPTLSQAQWAMGCGDVLVSNGSITDSSNWVYPTGRAPRTSVGIKADGTMVFYTVDGRQTGYSGGLTEMDLAQEMQRQGCVWAVNLDGGGSTTFCVQLPGQSGPAVANSPSDGGLRACASFLLLVTDSGSASGGAQRLALAEDGLVVLAGSSVTLGNVVSVNGGLETVNYRVADAAFSSQGGLGSFDGGVYTAGTTPGTDTISITSPSLGVSGTAQIHVVSSLSTLSVTRAGSTTAISSLSVEPGQSVALSATGAYWSRTALRASSGGVHWSVTGDAGTITQNGVFTASSSGAPGTITVTAGGLTRTIAVNEGRYVHTDVTPDHWSYAAVEFCYQQGIVNGISSTLFGRDEPIRRCDFVVMLYNAMDKPLVSGSSGFSDVRDGVYYANAVTWGSGAGLVLGTGAGLFSPSDSITREQAATILYRAMPLLGLYTPGADLSILNQFSDQAQIASYARAPLAVLVSLGIFNGTGSGLNPKGNLTRAEMAALLYRLLANPDDIPDLPQLGPDASLSLSQTSGTLAPSQTLRLTATLTGGDSAITWTSSNPSVAVVSSDGTVTNVYTGVGAPSVTITAHCGPLSASAVLQCSPAETVGLVTASPSLNVRSGPGTGYPVIGSLRSGAQVAVLGADSGWYQVLFASGSSAVTGWVSSSYVALS
ncbi:MAG TPA: S-layer homology domain-containing protein [Candidatus Enterenecus stercoripullorum]|nr:S-layer homology domain-containing protein [Candidatus Enterenecus stercoripullorum]